MSARDQDSGEPSAASASSSPPTAEEQRRTLQLLEAKIEKLESKIAEDEAEIKTIKSEAERLKRLDLLGKDKNRLQDFEQDVRDLRKKIEELSAPVEQPTAAVRDFRAGEGAEGTVSASPSLPCVVWPSLDLLSWYAVGLMSTQWTSSRTSPNLFSNTSSCHYPQESLRLSDGGALSPSQQAWHSASIQKSAPGTASLRKRRGFFS
eukprot:m.182285 g.182285  ORF g.182285 m.182285 type:complete len:206 (+) comp24633_c0_seq3:2704-3321(+)